eukprot:TRINITY_DN21595_c0_g1_i1.p1 TRINITY_DN21595_c0_g1~~TRINITY_DN21595_c0_g1_i1.p1  ORF type:complete len:288 (+),score=51.82 TRINITY_DN21595_c0_g1_i1:51-914(+)
MAADLACTERRGDLSPDGDGRLLNLTVDEAMQALDLPENTLEISQEDIPGVEGAFVLRDVLTSDECERYRNLTDEMGYQAAPLKIQSIDGSDGQYAWNVKANTRVIWDSVPAAEAERVWNRVAPFVPTQPPGVPHPEEWEAVGLTQKWRFYRYEPGQKLHPHFDVTFLPEDNELATLVTVTLYLNDCFEQGHTTFYPDGDVGGAAVPVTPVMGSAIVFPHGASSLSPLHEGSPPSEGVKYVLHTDVLYRRVAPPASVCLDERASAYYVTRDFTTFYVGPSVAELGQR